jgi:cytochrome c oxidase cbb3-type subunit I/II
MKSYSVYAGVQDALVQWWYGHNAVAFPYKPSVDGGSRLSIPYRCLGIFVLDFFYIWAGPILLYSALPNWAKLGVAFSILLAPSWGDDKWFANVAWCLG